MVTTTAHMGEHPDVRQRRGRWRSAATARIFSLSVLYVARDLGRLCSTRSKPRARSLPPPPPKVTQHRCNLPFLSDVHRFNPPRRGRQVLPARAALAAVAAAVVGTVPWVGQGPCPDLTAGQLVFFDGVYIPSRGAFAAAFIAPHTAVLTRCDGDQQHAELTALLLALHLAASMGLKRCVLVGDSTSALHGSMKLSCPSSLPHRAAALRHLVHIILASDIVFGLKYIPGKYNPADPISRAIPPPSAPVPWVLPCDHPAVVRAAEFAATARPRPVRPPPPRAPS
eukprot:gene57527-biopygen54736